METGSSALRVALVAPLASADIRHLLPDQDAALPVGYPGAPFMATLVEGLLSLGHSVTAITLSADLPLVPRGTIRAASGAFEVVFCPYRPRAWPPNGWRPGHIMDLFWFERRALRQAILEARPDVVHAHWSYEFAWAALSSGLPHVVTCHDSPFKVASFYKGQGFKYWGYRLAKAWMAWYVLQQAQVVTAVSPYLAQEVQPLCRVGVEVVPNPLPPAAFCRRDAEPLEHHRPRVLMVCNGWGALKNPSAALRAFALLAQDRPDVELVVLGADLGPGQRGEIWWRSEKMSGEVRFVGAVPSDEVRSWMARSDVLVHPSLEESFGMVLVEAMAAGLPVVAGVHSGAVPWVVGPHGCLVDVEDPVAICHALRQLIDDPGQRFKLAHSARDYLGLRFDPSVVANDYGEKYLQALVGSGNRN